MNDKPITLRQRRRRSREHLLPDEVAKLLAAAKNPDIVSEACSLKLSDVNLKEKQLYVKRLKNGVSTTHPLYNGEAKAIQAWFLALPTDLRPDTAAQAYADDHPEILSRVYAFLRGERPHPKPADKPPTPRDPWWTKPTSKQQRSAASLKELISSRDEEGDDYEHDSDEPTGREEPSFNRQAWLQARIASFLASKGLSG